MMKRILCAIFKHKPKKFAVLVYDKNGDEYHCGAKERLCKRCDEWYVDWEYKKKKK